MVSMKYCVKSQKANIIHVGIDNWKKKEKRYICS